MLLAPTPSMQNDTKPPVDYSSYKPHLSRYSPPESPQTLPSFFNDRDTSHSMNNSHRGLPPPVGMSLPPPNDRSLTTTQSLGQLPAPPSQWASSGADESMRHWLQAKAEEDRRRQEEERTKQETLKLDQRKVEQTMLRESLQGGVPPPMVPLIFAGIGGGNLPGHTIEWAQQYLASMSLQNQQQQQQLQAQQQHMQQIQHQQQQPSPEMSRDRGIPSNPYGPPPALPSSSQQAQQNRGVIVAPPPSTSLSRLNTVDLQPASSQPSRQQIQPAPPPPAEQGSGTGLFFHHWVPPSSNQPPTPSGKSNQGSPYAQTAPAHLRSDYQNTPKKRKTVGGHSGGPTSHQNDPSPPHSRSSRERELSPRPDSKSETRHHSRQRSDASSRDMDGRQLARPSSRQQRRDEMNGIVYYDPRRQMVHEEDHHHSHHRRWESSKSENR